MTDNADGLSFYRQLLDETPLHLKAADYLLCELGYQQAEAVTTMLKEGGQSITFIVKIKGSSFSWIFTVSDYKSVGDFQRLVSQISPESTQE